MANTLHPGECVTFAGFPYLTVSGEKNGYILTVPVEPRSLAKNYEPLRASTKKLTPLSVPPHLGELVDALRDRWQPCWVTGTCQV